MSTYNISRIHSWLYSRYNVGCEWWEIHELSRKLFLCSVIMFIDVGILRVPIAIIVSIMAIVSLNLWQAHKSKIVFKVASIAFVGTALKFVGGLSLLAASRNASWKDALGWFLLALDLGIAVSAMGAIVLLIKFIILKTRTVREMVLARSADRTQRKQTRQQETRMTAVKPI